MNSQPAAEPSPSQLRHGTRAVPGQPFRPAASIAATAPTAASAAK